MQVYLARFGTPEDLPEPPGPRPGAGIVLRVTPGPVTRSPLGIRRFFARTPPMLRRHKALLIVRFSVRI